jgi:hypothetical protein
LSNIDLQFDHLIPNRVYTAWVGWVNENGGGFEFGPLGGVPSAFSSDDLGKAQFKRILDYCPLLLLNEGRTQIIKIVIAMHSDHRVYGAVPALLGRGFLGGTTSHSHLEFNFLGTVLGN